MKSKSFSELRIAGVFPEDKFEGRSAHEPIRRNAVRAVVDLSTAVRRNPKPFTKRDLDDKFRPDRLRQWHNLFTGGRQGAEGRHIDVYTLSEIGHLLSKFPELVKCKQVWPGASVIAAKGVIDDPLMSVHDLNDSLVGI
jgi:hypothetical protein